LLHLSGFSLWLRRLVHCWAREAVAIVEGKGDKVADLQSAGSIWPKEDSL
jgi:hypothetical protein